MVDALGEGSLDESVRVVDVAAVLESLRVADHHKTGVPMEDLVQNMNQTHFFR